MPCPALEHARLRLVVGTLALSVVWVLIVSDKSWSDGRTAATLAATQDALFAIHIVRFKDADMARLLFGFGLALGMVELAADALCVRFTHTLDYAPARSAMLGLSPWWMPFAWMTVSTQIGYLGACLIDHLGAKRGILLTAMLGAITIPFYEEMAFHAHWWQYVRCRMAAEPGRFLSHTPLYIIIAELVIGASLAPLARHALRGEAWRTAVGAGVLGGLATILGGLLGFGLMERIL